MTMSPRFHSLVVCLVSFSALPLQAGPLDDLLPPPLRQSERRFLGGNEERMRRSQYYDGRQGAGAAFSPDAKHLITLMPHIGMSLWDVGSGRSVAQFGLNQSGEGLTLAFTPDGKHFITASAGNHRGNFPVTLWNVAKRERVRVLDDEVNDTPITAIAITPDGKTLTLAAGWGHRNEAYQLIHWDIATGDEIGRIDGLVTADPQRNRNNRAFEAIAYSPDGRTLAALTEGRIILVETATGRSRGELTFPTTPENPNMPRMHLAQASLAFSPDGRTLAVGNHEGLIRRFDLRTGREMTPLPGGGSAVVALAWSADASRLFAYGQDGQFATWRTDVGRDWQPKAGPLSDEALASLWELLRGEDPADLFGCHQVLCSVPTQTIALLRKHVSPAPKADGKRLEKLVEEMQKGDYNTRKRAVVELRKIGAPALDTLRKSIERGVYDELTQRLMQEFSVLPVSPEQTRSLRALGVLEGIGDAEARKFLAELADGSPEALLTTHAKDSLERMRRTETAGAEPKQDALWNALAAEDSAAAYRAIRTLAAKPATAAFLKARLKEVLAKDLFNDDPKRMEKRIEELGADTYAVREQATKALRNLGRIAVPALRKAQDAKLGAETERRLQNLINAALKTAPPPEMLRINRVLETYEMMGGAEARQATQELTRDDVTTHWLREAARQSLRRQEAVK